ncbi:pentapeptide repeat-containing protein [Salmonella enterica]
MFDRIQLDNFNFRDCEFENCRFINCSIKNLKLNFFKLIDCEFKDCLLQGVNASEIMFPCTKNICHSYTQGISVSLCYVNSPSA